MLILKIKINHVPLEWFVCLGFYFDWYYWQYWKDLFVRVLHTNNVHDHDNVHSWWLIVLPHWEIRLSVPCPDIPLNHIITLANQSLPFYNILGIEPIPKILSAWVNHSFDSPGIWTSEFLHGKPTLYHLFITGSGPVGTNSELLLNWTWNFYSRTYMNKVMPFWKLITGVNFRPLFYWKTKKKLWPVR